MCEFGFSIYLTAWIFTFIADSIHSSDLYLEGSKWHRGRHLNMLILLYKFRTWTGLTKFHLGAALGINCPMLTKTGEPVSH